MTCCAAGMIRPATNPVCRSATGPRGLPVALGKRDEVAAGLSSGIAERTRRREPELEAASGIELSLGLAETQLTLKYPDLLVNGKRRSRRGLRLRRSVRVAPGIPVVVRGQRVHRTRQTACRRPGVLYEALFDRQARRGFRTAVAGMTLPNEARVGLHRAMGFTQAGTYRRIGWKHGTWHDVAMGSADTGSRPGDRGPTR